ncbi:MAG: diguanylate cyclase, partial [Thiovulaceae bacterium]|nr:diguanylate cyclase [Sulfurimonadaceae bacterium]
MEYNTQENLTINDFILTSSSEVDETVRGVGALAGEALLIHISSYIHNTVLVQNLKTQLEKKVPHAKLV